MSLLYVKALHIIFVVTWFSGMFYLCRLYVYVREAQDKAEPEKTILTEQFKIMVKRLLFGITWPSAVLTLIFGLWLYFSYSLIPLWLHLKLGVVLLLYLYHFSLHWLYKQQKTGNYNWSSTKLRLWNELPTLFLVAIVMLVVVRQEISVVYGLLGLLGIGLTFFAAVKIYKALRKE